MPTDECRESGQSDHDIDDALRAGSSVGDVFFSLAATGQYPPGSVFATVCVAAGQIERQSRRCGRTRKSRATSPPPP
jgi:hypothetical protein